MMKSLRLSVQPLEERALMSWAGIPPVSVAPGARVNVALTDKQLSVAGKGAITNGEVDYFAFTAPTSGSYQFDITTPTGNLNPVAALFDSAGNRLAYNDDVSGVETDSEFVTAVVAGQKYFLGVTNDTGTLLGKYAWKITTAGADDTFESNDTSATAKNLGLVKVVKDVTGLAMRDQADWFKFSYTGLAGVGSQVQITFTNSQGDIDLKLFDAQGNLVRASTGSGDAETVSLDTLVGGTYYVNAYGFNGATNPSYNLSIDINATPIPHGSRTLYLNFDGGTISHKALLRFSPDWALFPDAPEYFDSAHDGIHVKKFMAGTPRAGEREQIISLMMQYLQEDLRKFGIKVVRHVGAPVENQFATTVFLGQSDLENNAYHIACDIDIGNNNKTDIAFVGNEDWGNAADTALALSDVALHESGHTFGLWHVNTLTGNGLEKESMGLRYSTSDQNLWLANTSFNDVTYNEYSNHGPTAGANNDPQNSFTSMAKAFGLVSAFAAPTFTVDTSAAGVMAITTAGAADRVEIEQLDGGVIEVRVNGKVRRVTGGGLREVRVNTNGDARDRVTVVNDLGGVTVSTAPALSAEKVADADAGRWNGTALPAAVTAGPAGSLAYPVYHGS